MAIERVDITYGSGNVFLDVYLSEIWKPAKCVLSLRGRNPSPHIVARSLRRLLKEESYKDVKRVGIGEFKEGLSSGFREELAGKLEDGLSGVELFYTEEDYSK